MKFEFSRSYEDEAGIVVVFDCTYTFGDPGKCYGPPERCYPPEPADYDLENPRVDLGTGRTRKLTADELKALGCETEQDLVNLVMEEDRDDVHEQAEEAAEARYSYPD